MGAEIEGHWPPKRGTQREREREVGNGNAMDAAMCLCLYKEGLIGKDKNSGCLPAGDEDTDKKNKKV